MFHRIDVFHPLDRDAHEHGCRRAEKYIDVYNGNLTSEYGHCPDRELVNRAMETVILGLLGCGIIPRHDLKFFIFDTRRGWDEDDANTLGEYIENEKAIVIYASSVPWSLERLISVLIHEVGHYLFITMGIEDDEELCERLEQSFPHNEEFMKALARKWQTVERGGGQCPD
jgi:hypothetical protein